MGDFTRVKSPMSFHRGFYPSGNTLDYKMTHWLFTLFQIISNILTSSLLTFSVIYTFYFYIASEGLKIYQKYLIKKVPDFPFLEKFIWDNLNEYLRNYFLERLSNFSLLLLLFDSSNLVSRATWRNEHNQVIQTQAKILSLTENSSLKREKIAQWFWTGSLLVKLKAACFISRGHTEWSSHHNSSLGRDYLIQKNVDIVLALSRHSPHLACRAWKVELFTICLKQLPHGLFL